MPDHGSQGSFIGTNNQEKAKRLTGEHPQTAPNYVEVMASRDRELCGIWANDRQKLERKLHRIINSRSSNLREKNWLVIPAY